MNLEFETARPYLAHPDQLCYVRLSRLEEGSGRGQRIVDVCNGSGLNFTVTPDRGMNLVECSFRGIPIAFRTPAGHRNSHGNWLADWPGGLMTTAGLRNVGLPSGSQGLHGAISSEAAEQLACRNRDGQIEISGVLREGHLFSSNLSLERSIRTACGDNRIYIADRVTNHGEADEFTEILYHCNFGYPLISPALEFEAPPHQIEPRDAGAAAGIAEWNSYPPPLTGFTEHCFRHRLSPDAAGWARMRILNRPLGIAVTVRYDTAALPYLVQWKKPSRNAYVLGLEPTNASLNGCDSDRNNQFGNLLAPGETICYRMELLFETLAQPLEKSTEAE